MYHLKKIEDSKAETEQATCLTDDLGIMEGAASPETLAFHLDLQGVSSNAPQQTDALFALHAGGSVT